MPAVLSGLDTIGYHCCVTHVVTTSFTLVGGSLWQRRHAFWRCTMLVCLLRHGRVSAKAKVPAEQST